MQVTLDEGKYSIVIEAGVTTVYRNGEKWQDLTGDNLIFNLVHRVNELTTVAEECSEQLKTVAELVESDGGEAIDWLIDNQYKNQELSEALRDATEA